MIIKTSIPNFAHTNTYVDIHVHEKTTSFKQVETFHPTFQS